MDQFDIQSFFQQLNNTESLLFIAFCLGAFILGIFLGLALRGRKVRKLKKELKKKEQELNEANTTIETQTQRITQLEADLKKSAYDLNQIRINADRYEKKNEELHMEINQLKANLDKNQQSNVTYDATLEDLQTQIAVLKAQNEDLQKGNENGSNGGTNTAQIGALQQQINYLKTRNEQLQQEVDTLQAGDGGDQSGSARVGVLEQQVNYLKEQNAELMERLAAQTTPVGITPDTTSEDRLSAFEARLAQLEQENATLQASIEGLNQSRSDNDNAAELPSTEIAPEIIATPRVDLFKTDRALLQDQARDDLSRIDGIGPFIEKKLNDANVYTFEQIANWSAQDIKQVTQQIQYFEGRIEKDNWVGQAEILMNTPTPEVADTESSDPEA
ncbi:MAG: hypothetical protein AAF705_14995, partial [Bacteroidota bacterium]